jgi:cytidylate kinase
MSLITITTGIGCEGMAIGQLVCDGLKLKLYDDQRLQEEASKIGIPTEALETLDEKAPGLFSRLLSRKPDVYLDLMESVIYEVAHRGEGVIMGHGAQLLLRDFNCALHARIYASEPFRIQHLMDRQGLSQEAAEKMIHKSDSERRGFLQFAFHKDWDDPSLYDLIINRDKLSADSAAGLIVEVAQSQEIKECSLTALDAMERRSLSKKIEAALLRNDISPSDFHIEIPEKGVALIRGWTHTQGDKDRLLEVAREVPGVSEVKSEVNVVPISGV